MEVNEVIIVIIGGTLIMLALFAFIISFFFIHQKRQQAHKLEKASLEAQFNEEILTSKNEVQESTMKHIARELHDNVGQMLSLVKIQLNNIDDENPGIKRVGDSKEFLSKAIKDLRSLSKSLNSDNILNSGLSKAIEFELGRIVKVGVCEVELNNEVKDFNVKPESEIIIFRIFQEIIQNVIRHSRAKTLKVSLEESGEVYTLVVLDNGRGFDVEEKSKIKSFKSGAGLANLKNRAKLINGDLTIESAVGQGTKITLLIPKKSPSSHDSSRPSR